MTDNRTTETATGRLRALLNERDAEWKQGMAWNVTVINGDWLVVEDVDFGTLSVSTMAYMLTPEQAIAATLGSDNEYEAKMDALLCRLTNGKWSKTRQYSLEFMDTCISEEFEALYSEEQFSASVSGTLTAEQVREAVEKHWHDLSDEYDMPEATALPEYSYNWQAIADELNVELGSGTCIVTHDFNCSNCGKQIGVVRNCEMYETCDGRQAWKSLDHEACDVPNYCPNCGAKVVGK